MNVILDPCRAVDLMHAESGSVAVVDEAATG